MSRFVLQQAGIFLFGLYLYFCTAQFVLIDQSDANRREAGIKNPGFSFGLYFRRCYICAVRLPNMKFTNTLNGPNNGNICLDRLGNRTFRLRGHHIVK